MQRQHEEASSQAKGLQESLNRCQDRAAKQEQQLCQLSHVRKHAADETEMATQRLNRQLAAERRRVADLLQSLQHKESELGGMQSRVSSLEIELAGLAADRDHFKALQESSDRAVEQLQACAYQATAQAQALAQQAAGLNRARNALTAQLAAAQAAAASDCTHQDPEAAGENPGGAHEQSGCQAHAQGEHIRSLTSRLEAAQQEAVESYVQQESSAQEIGALQAHFSDLLSRSHELARQAAAAHSAESALQAQLQSLLTAAAQQGEEAAQAQEQLAQAGQDQRALSEALDTQRQCCSQLQAGLAAVGSELASSRIALDAQNDKHQVLHQLRMPQSYDMKATQQFVLPSAIYKTLGEYRTSCCHPKWDASLWAHQARTAAAAANPFRRSLNH